MNNKKRTGFLFVLVALVAGYLMFSPIAKAAGNPGEDSKEVSQLLNDAKAEAHELELDTHVIESFVKSNLSWESHIVKLNEIREHINRTGKLLTKLQGARDNGTPWQQKAIDEIEPLLRELAANTKSTIDHFSDNKDRLHMSPTYQEYLATNAQVAKELAALITDYIDYGFHEAELKRLGEKVVASDR